MVEIRRYAAAVAATAAVIFGAAGQNRRVIAGLEGDEAYRSLVASEAALVRTADSLAREVSALRRSLRADTAGRAETSAAIVRLEGRSFDVRSRMADLASRINLIEQEWILHSMLATGDVTVSGAESGAGSGGEDTAAATDGQGGGAEFFRRNLSPEQLAEQTAAERGERDMPRLFGEYRVAHARLADLVRLYEQADTQGALDSLRARFSAVSVEERRIDAEAAALWESVFDSKSYIYSLLAEKMNYGDLTAAWADNLAAAGGELARVRAASASTAMAHYAVQKPLLVAFETALARKVGDERRADSLELAAADVPSVAETLELTPATLSERLLLDWADVAVGRSPYSSANPIPEVRVWPRGIIWRVRLGTFSARQAVSIFRGASPLAVERAQDGRYRYYAGGFRTDSLAAAAVEKLRGVGFRAPVAVVWMDGTLIEPDSADDTRRYRVEIEGVEELPEEVRALADGMGVVRGADRFVVTPLDGTSAARLRTALEALKPALTGLDARLLQNPESSE